MSRRNPVAKAQVTRSLLLEPRRRQAEWLEQAPGRNNAVYFVADEVEAWLKHRKDNPPRRGRPKGPEKPKPPTGREVKDRASLARLLVSLELKVETLEAKVTALEGAG